MKENMDVSKETREKEQALIRLLRELDCVAVAFSGGVDSALLTALAYETLGSKATAVTVSSPLLPANEREDAMLMGTQIGIRHVVVEMDELTDETFSANPPDKCYICKKMRFTRMAAWAQEQAEKIPFILDGSNADDMKDYRPGMKALKEIAVVRSPMLEVGLTKREIRELSRDRGLFTWDKPARACLASRLPYGETITEEKLRRIEAAENFIGTLLPHVSQFRVRSHGDIARIEMDSSEALKLLTPEWAEQIHDHLRRLGFQYVTLDLKGYRMGSLNEALR